jgi:cell division septation protein DedD
MVAAGESHYMAVLSDGTLWGWGSNSGGKLGTGNTSSYISPTLVTSNIAFVAAGKNHTLYIKSDETLWGVGDMYGTVPTLITSSVKFATGGDGNTFFITSTGDLWGMGNNDQGQLGDGSNTYRAVPVFITSSVVSASLSSRGGSIAGFGAYITSDNKLWTFGDNFAHQLLTGNNIDKNIPQNVGDNATDVSVGGVAQTIYIKTSNRNGDSVNTLWGGGDCYGYALGFCGGTPYYQQQLYIGGGWENTENISKCRTGKYRTIFLKTDGTLWQASGAYGTGAITSSVVSMDMTVLQYVFAKSDGTVWTENGQVNFDYPTPTPTPTSTPTPTPTPTDTPTPTPTLTSTPTPTPTPTSTPTSTPSPPTPTPRPVVRLKCATPTIKKLSRYKLEISHTGLPYYNWNIFWIVYRYPQGGIISRGIFSSGKVVVDLVDSDNILVAQCNDKRSVYIPSATVRTYSTIKQ